MKPKLLKAPFANWKPVLQKEKPEKLEEKKAHRSRSSELLASTSSSLLFMLFSNYYPFRRGMGDSECDPAF